ncbi:MAG: hypothetical protein ACXWLI_11365 [Myxococcaceae bacterium]
MSSKVISLAAALVLGGVLLTPSTAAADDRDWYFMAKFGPYFPTAQNLIDTATGATQTWPTGWEADGAIGHWWGPFALELDAGYLNTGSGSTAFKTWPILAVTKLRLPLEILAPYGELGAGVAISSLGGGSSTAAFEAMIGLGLEFSLGPILLGADAKFFWLNPNFTLSGATTSTNYNFSGITVQAYLGYRF